MTETAGSRTAPATVPRLRLRPRTVSLSITLAVAIGSLVTAAVATVLAIGFLAGQRNTIDLLRDKTDLGITLLEDAVRHLLDPAREQVRFLAGRIADGDLDPADAAHWTAALAGAVSATPQVIAVAWWDSDLAMTYAERQPDRVVIGHDADRPFPDIAAVMARPEAAAAPEWGPVVFGRDIPEALINVRQAVRRDGRVLGVLAAAVTTRDLSRLMVDGTDSFRANAFILYGNDRVLAHRNIGLGLAVPTPEQPLPALDQVGDPVLAQIWTARDDNPIREAVAEGMSGHSAVIDGEPYSFLYRPLEGEGRHPLLIGTYVRSSQINAEIRRLIGSGMAGLAVLALALVAAVAMGRLIARPVRRLAERAGRIGSLELGAVEPLPGSAFTELDEQARAFNTMLVGLRWLDTYVPKSLVRRLMDKGEEGAVRSVERELTVLFTDIAGFTAASETLPAAETAEFLNRHFALLGACVEAEGGTIDKFIGDALMAFWGAPERQADHAARACRAALAMARAVAADNAERAAAGLPAVRIRIGIHSGPVVVGNIGAPGRMNYTIVGDAVNTGNRLEQLGKRLGDPARAVTILISSATAAQLGPEFAPVSCGRHQVPGRQEAIEVFALE